METKKNLTASTVAHVRCVIPDYSDVMWNETFAGDRTPSRDVGLPKQQKAIKRKNRVPNEVSTTISYVTDACSGLVVSSRRKRAHSRYFGGLASHVVRRFSKNDDDDDDDRTGLRYTRTMRRDSYRAKRRRRTTTGTRATRETQRARVGVRAKTSGSRSRR